MKLNAFSFADDLVLVANKKEELSQLFEILTSWCDENHFQINTKKSGVFITGEDQDKFFLGEEEIPQLETLKYLGIEIEKNGSYNKYLTRICAQTRATLQQFHSLLSRYDLAFCIRLRLARSLVLSRLAYGQEIIPLENTQLEKLERVFRKTIAQCLICRITQKMR